LLYQVIVDKKLDMSLRKNAYEAMSKLESTSAVRRLSEFSNSDSDDPLAKTVRQNLAWD
jgi:hypothetical protein